MSNSLLQTGLALPALRGRQGARLMYLVLPENAVLNTFFTTEMEPMEDRSQRQLDPRHAREIGDYIVRNPEDYALGAITYAVDQPGDFEELVDGTGIGVLRLPLNARLRSVDGQHRRHGIKQAIDTASEIADQHTALLIYVEPDLSKRRQMFSDMNNTVKKVSKAINISFDSRDPFARAVNRLIVEHSLLADHVEVHGTRVLAGSPHYYTLAAIHDAAKRLFVGPTGRVRDQSKFKDDEIYRVSADFFDMLGSARDEFRVASDPAALEQLRSESILFSSTTLRVIAGAVWAVLGGEVLGKDQSMLTGPLSRVDFSPTAALWLESGFVTPGRSTPNARSQELHSATQALSRAIERRLEKRGMTVHD